MKINLLLLLVCLFACTFLLQGCGADPSSGAKATTIRDPGKDPGTVILPYVPPDADHPGQNAEDDPGSGDNGGDSGGKDDTGTDQQPIPEPSTLLLVGSGIALISLCKKKKKSQET